MQIEKTIKIDISDKDIEIVRLIAEGETKNKIMTFSPVQTNS